MVILPHNECICKLCYPISFYYIWNINFTGGEKLPKNVMKRKRVKVGREKGKQKEMRSIVRHNFERKKITSVQKEKKNENECTDLCNFFIFIFSFIFSFD